MSTERELLRAAASVDLRSYVRYTMPTYRENWHHRVFMDALQGLAEGRINKLLVTAPPRHGKSELISRRFPAWLLGGAWPSVQIISASHTHDLAEKMGRDVQRILRSAAHREVFPGFHFGEKETYREFDVQDGGVYIGAGVGGAIAGRGGNILLVDDPMASREAAESARIKDKVWDWFNDDALTRLEPPGAICVTATRWAVDDLSGRILAGPDADDWVHIHLPAILDEDPPPYDGDPRALGQPLWPGRYVNPKAKETLATVDPSVLEARALADLERRRRANPYGFQALYQGWPTERGGSLFLRENMRTYNGSPQAMAATCDWVCISVDATFGASKRGDFVSIAVIGGRGAQRFLLDEHTERLTYPQTKAALLAMAQKWPQASVLIEAKANGQALIDDLKGTLPRVLPFVPTNTKQARASLAAEVWAAGQLFVPATPAQLSTIGEWLEDVVGFPGRPHDDRVDALSQCLLHYQQRGDGLAALRRITDGYLPGLGR